MSQELMQLRIVIACTLPFEFQVAYLYGIFGQRKPAVRAEGPCYWRACVGRQVVPLERRPHPHVLVTSDSEHTQQSNADRSDSPYRFVARKFSCIILSSPLLFHGTPPVAASARRCRALLNLFWSARSMSCCISSAVS